MMHTRLRSAASITTLIATTVVSLWPAIAAAAAGQVATFEFVPHCATLAVSSSSSFAGPLPNVEYLVGSNPSAGNCPGFVAGEQQTIETPVLKNGDILDFDINLTNPEKVAINRVRIWLAYDPAVLSGTTLEIDKAFPTITATERGFSGDEGYLKIAARSADSAAPAGEVIHIARVKMKVISSKGTSTALSFFEAKGDMKSRTVAITGKGKDEVAILSLTLNSLIVKLDGSGEPASSSAVAETVSSASQLSSSSSVSSLSASSAAVSADSSASATSTSSSVVSSSRSSQSLLTIGGLSSSKSSSSEASETSSASDATSSSSAASASPEFLNLQVSNLTVGTEGTSALLTWSPVSSEELKGYNLYYSTTSGIYTRRRTLTKDSLSEIIKDLPDDTVHYFAVRALSVGGGESQYSQEVAIVIGRPETSTAPLVQNPPPVTTTPTPLPAPSQPTEVVRPPVTLPKPTTAPELAAVTAKPKTGGRVAGNTGVDDWVNGLLLAFAVTGTVAAFRRQLLPSTLDA